MKEESTNLKISKNVFYNSKMHFCRSLSSLGVGAIEKDLNIADGFSATGIRGIRYSKENKNVKKIYFLDASPSAIKLTKQNLKLNKLKGKTIEGDFNRLIRELDTNFIEIDPFGTPVPYLYDAIRSLKNKKQAFLSITATDVAVLCGPHFTACLKNYHSRSLNNEFTHENGLRILLKRIAETLMEFNFGLIPLFSISDQHYLKIFARIKRGDKFTSNSIKNIGFVSYCFKCGNRIHGKIMKNVCDCETKMDYAGPLWIGELHDKKFIEKMKSLNKKRKYLHKEKIEKTLDLMKGEISLPPYYFDLHKLSKIRKKNSIPSISLSLKKLSKKGHKVSRTHFSSNSIKTNAKIEEIMKILYH